MFYYLQLALFVAHRVSDSYVFRSVIGKGCFGVVRKVQDKQTKEYMACKTLDKGDKTPAYLLKREIESLRQIQHHPHLIALKGEVYEDDSYIHIVTELCTGGELYDRLATGKWAIREREAAILISNILQAIAHSHERGVVHRDLKASNFLFATKNTNTNVKIIDFGLSRSMMRSQQSTTSISNNNEDEEEEEDDLAWVLKSKVGTPYYVAPEVLIDESYSAKCDVWSIGVIAYVVLTRGRLPYCGKDERETLQLLKDPTTSVQFSHKVWKSYSPAAKEFCKALLQKDPNCRPTSKEALELEWLKRKTTRNYHRRSVQSLMLCVAVALIAIALPLLLSADIDMTSEELTRLAQDRSILVTGANSGLGLATVKLIGQLGTAKNVLLVCRNVAKCEEARNQVQLELPESSNTQVLTVQLDLANRTSIAEGARVVQHYLSDIDHSHSGTAPLDILINNAGVAFAWGSKDFVEGVEMHMGINHLGHVLLTHMLWKNLLASSFGARIVHVSSLGAFLSWRDGTLGWYDRNPNDDMGKLLNTLDSMRYYFQSKRANLMQTWELHRRYSTESGISSVASHPGYTRSEGILKFQLPLCPDFLKEWLHSNRLMSMSTEEGAKTQLLAALAPNDIVPSGSHVVPKYWTTGNPILLESLMKRFSTHFWTFSETESSSLWDESMKALGISEFGKLQEYNLV